MCVCLCAECVNSPEDSVCSFVPTPSLTSLNFPFKIPLRINHSWPPFYSLHLKYFPNTPLTHLTLYPFLTIPLLTSPHLFPIPPLLHSPHLTLILLFTHLTSPPFLRLLSLPSFFKPDSHSPHFILLDFTSLYLLPHLT